MEGREEGRRMGMGGREVMEWGREKSRVVGNRSEGGRKGRGDGNEGGHGVGDGRERGREVGEWG